MSLVKVKNLDKVYENGKISFQALYDINLQIEKGEMVTLIGPSGSGKSTLMNIIGCLDKPTRGKYYFNGKSVDEMNQNQLAQIRNENIGFVFQTFHLLPRLTAFENVELPLIYAGESPKERQKKVMNALEIVGLKDRIKHKPNELSGGEKQRVAIARAIINNPELILADEPTGNLDSKTGEDIINLFKELNNRGNTVVIVTHDVKIARNAKRIISLLDGRIIKDEIKQDKIILEV